MINFIQKFLSLIQKTEIFLSNEKYEKSSNYYEAI